MVGLIIQRTDLKAEPLTHPELLLCIGKGAMKNGNGINDGKYSFRRNKP